MRRILHMDMDAFFAAAERFRDFKTYTRAKTLPEVTDSLVEIRKAAFECLGRLELNRKVRLIGVRIGHLEKVEPGPSQISPQNER